ncbi:MAG: hypothetical protein EHM20_09640 [Alphaproteobacteria bacterium]|nr:MAG: hypothetical protein EHM20_09640 [Alphaproteobacteria bacterium]
MSAIRTFIDNHFARKMTRIKLVLLVSFSTLMLFQFLVGFGDFEDYLVAFIFILFLNDLYFKIKRPDSNQFNNERVSRLVMSMVFFGLFSLPFIFDSVNVSDETRLMLYKLGFVLWAQVFLIDSFLHYRQTQSKQWLVFANAAVLLIVIGAFIN